MDDPDHTRNPVILEEGVLPSKCSVCVMGILEVGSDYCSPPWLPPKKKKKKVKIIAPVSKLQSDDSQCSEVPDADIRPFLLSAFLKVNLQLPSTWLQSCLPLSESQLHRRGAVPVKAVIFHTQTHASVHLHRCAVHTHTHTDKHLQQQLFLAAVEGRNNAFWPVCGEIYRCAHMERLFTAQVHQEAS